MTRGLVQNLTEQSLADANFQRRIPAAGKWLGMNVAAITHPFENENSHILLC